MLSIILIHLISYVPQLKQKVGTSWSNEYLLILHDNVPVHTAYTSRQTLRRNSFEEVDHLLADLIPSCDFLWLRDILTINQRNTVSITNMLATSEMLEAQRFRGRMANNQKLKIPSCNMQNQ